LSPHYLWRGSQLFVERKIRGKESEARNGGNEKGLEKARPAWKEKSCRRLESKRENLNPFPRKADDYQHKIASEAVDREFKNGQSRRIENTPVRG